MVAAATHRQKDLFFFLVQNEYGDIFKVTLDYQEDRVNAVKLSYFDTVPVATGLVVLKTGFLFVAAEFGNHYLFQFQSLGEDGSEDVPNEFQPRDLVNLAPVDEMPSLAPITNFKVADLTGEGTPQIYALSGRGQNSALKILRHGLSVTEMAVSELPGNPSAIWSLKGATNDEFHKYIVVSYINATMVLSVGETVEEVTDTGILDKTQTLLIESIADDSFVQIHPNGIRHIKADKRVQEWKPPSGRQITQATANERQVVVALSGGHLVYFELGPNGVLMETEKQDLGREVSCLAIPPLQKSRQRSLFLAIGDYEDSVRIYSLEPEALFRQLSVQALSTNPTSILLTEMNESINSAHATLFLNVGLQNGVLMRTVVDQVTGELTQTRNRFLGSRPVRLSAVKVRDSNAVLALSSRSWLVYNYQTRLITAPLSYVPLDHAAAFSTDAVPEAFVTVSQNTLRIIGAENLGEFFNQTEIPLSNTPRQMVVHPQWHNLVIIETDHNAYTVSELAAVKDNVDGRDGKKDEADYDPADRMDVDEEPAEPDVPKPPYDPSTDPAFKFGFPKAGPNRWRSCIRLLDPNTHTTLHVIDLDNGEAAISINTFAPSDREEVFVVIGTMMHYQMNPRKSGGGYIHIFSLGDDGKRLRLVHKTPVEDVPLAVATYGGRLLAGVGQVLRLYDMGKKKLLRKCDLKTIPSLVKQISVWGDRILVGDVQEGWHYVIYDKLENNFYVFADEPRPRWLTTSVQLDVDTIAGADKFGNVFVTRLPENISLEVEGDTTSFRYMQPWCNGAPHKAESHCEFHVGEVVTCLDKASLVPGGTECLIYSTVYGTIGVLVPFISREDVDFFTHLEMHMRNEYSPILGRDHLSFRGYYQPQKACIDGDFCEVFNSLDAAKQSAVADEMDRSVAEMAKKLDDMRTQVI
jgi:splicing factor 3B subunit 3